MGNKNDENPFKNVMFMADFIVNALELNVKITHRQRYAQKESINLL